jgi:hypothetical protein
MSKNSYFKVVTVDGYAFPTDPQAVFDFNSQGFAFLNRGPYTVEYSFDGSTLHGDLKASDVSKDRVFNSRCECKTWFRAKDGYGDVRVEAWR